MKLLRDTIRGSTPYHIDEKTITLIVKRKLGKWTIKNQRRVSLRRLSKFDGYGVAYDTIKMANGKLKPRMWLSCHPFYVVPN